MKARVVATAPIGKIIFSVKLRSTETSISGIGDGNGELKTSENRGSALDIVISPSNTKAKCKVHMMIFL
jgi:hypothetical protein